MKKKPCLLYKKKEKQKKNVYLLNCFVVEHLQRLGDNVSYYKHLKTGSAQSLKSSYMFSCLSYQFWRSSPAGDLLGFLYFH